METQEASKNASSIFRNDSSEPPTKNKTFEPESSKSPKEKKEGLKDNAFLILKVMPPFLKPSPKAVLNLDDSLTSQLSTEKF